MKNILIINGGKQFGHSHGELNDTLTTVATEYLENAGLNVKVTKVDDTYDTKKEVQKYIWADLVIYQMPGWWMGTPWTVKKYMDEVFTEGHGSLYASDGRSRSDDSKKYGSGGLLQGKKHLLSLTWNAPEEAFLDPKQFFDGKGVDHLYYHFHKANEFLGMEALPTYIVFDVIKNPNIKSYIEGYHEHLNNIILGERCR